MPRKIHIRTKLVKRTKFKREQDLLKTQEMYLDGKTMLQISQTLGLSVGQVSYDLNQIMDRWEKQRFDNLDRIRAEELAKLNRDEQRFTQLWLDSLDTPNRVFQKSYSGKVKTKSVGGKQVVDDDSSPPEYFRKSFTEDGTRGNPFFWEQVKWCRAERARLLGLYAPKKIAATNIAGTEEASLTGGGDARDDVINMLLEIADKSLNDQKVRQLGGGTVDASVVDENVIDIEPEPDDKTDKTNVPELAPDVVRETVNQVQPVPDEVDEILETPPIVVASNKIDPLSDRHFEVTEQSKLLKEQKVHRAVHGHPTPYALEKPTPPKVTGTVQEELDFRRNSGIESAKQVNEYVRDARPEEETNPIARFIRNRKEQKND